MAKGKLSVALIGAGPMGRNHARVLAASPDVELDLVVDVDPERAAKVAADVGCRAAGELDDGAYDAAVVATPPDSHADLVVGLLDRGIPVLVEKPMAPSLAAVDAMLDAATRTGTPLTCGFVERYNPAVRTAIDLLDEDLIHLVAVRHSPSNPRATASVVIDLLVHDLDLTMQFAPRGVQPTGTASVWASPQTGVPEVADAVLRFGDAMVATLSASRASQRKIRTLTLSTTHRLFEIDLLRQDLTVYEHVEYPPGTPGASYRARTTVDIPFVRSRGEPLMVQLEHFVDLVRGESDPTAELATLRPAHAALDALVS